MLQYKTDWMFLMKPYRHVSLSDCLLVISVLQFLLKMSISFVQFDQKELNVLESTSTINVRLKSIKFMNNTHY